MNGASSVSGAFGSFYGPIIQFLGLSSIFGSVIGSSGKGFNLDGSAKWILLGSLVELGRRLFKWVMERFKFGLSIEHRFTRLFLIFDAEYSITGQFNEGDPAYEWILLFLVRISPHSMPSVTEPFALPRHKKRYGGVPASFESAQSIRNANGQFRMGSTTRLTATRTTSPPTTHRNYSGGTVIGWKSNEPRGIIQLVLESLLMALEVFYP